MNRKKVIIGVLMAAIFVMVAFIPLANNIPTDKGNTGVNSISPQIAISKYVINKSPAAKGNINSTISDKSPITKSTSKTEIDDSKNLEGTDNKEQ